MGLSIRPWVTRFFDKVLGSALAPAAGHAAATAVGALVSSAVAVAASKRDATATSEGRSRASLPTLGLGRVFEIQW